MPPLYGLDIETDTSVDGFDPGVAPILAIALTTDDDGDTVFTGAEAGVLAAVDARLAALPAGVIVTWNGSTFDLPFLIERAGRAGVELGLVIRHDPTLRLRHPPLGRHPGGYRASWHGHAHLDAYLAYRTLLDASAPGSLKAVARASGLVPVESDRAAIHQLGLAELRRYVTSDAALARQLAQRRWPEIERHVDDVRALADQR